MKFYVIDGKKVVETDNVHKWSKFFESKKRIVARTVVNDVTISTVFIGVGLQMFETMIFGGKLDGYQERCSTWEQAEKEHIKAMALVTKQLLEKLESEL